MRDEAKAEDLVDELRGKFAEHIRECVAGLPPAQALQLADSLCTVWIESLAGLRVTHRALPSADGAAISRDWSDGLTLAEVMARHECSRATAYRYHPSKRHRKSG